MLQPVRIALLVVALAASAACARLSPDDSLPALFDLQQPDKSNAAIWGVGD